MTLQSADVMTVLPEIILAVGAMALLMVGVFRDKSTSLINWLAVCLLVGAACAVYMTGEGKQLAFDGLVIVDSFARFMKVLALIGAAAAILMSTHFVRIEKFERFEFPILVVLATLGMLMMISSNDLISLYMGLELQSLSLYVVAAINRDSARSSEAGLKYFVLGALSSGMLLYGCSLVYGFAGSTNFEQISVVLTKTGGDLGILFGLVFIMAGLAFKISAVPFHMWTPDVYEGAPTPITAFFAAAPKVAAMAMTIRVLIGSFLPIADQWQQIVVFISIASMILGAFAALRQTNIKRLMAYSSIGHMGFALVGLSAGTEQGVKGVIVYMALYMVMTIGTFCCILAMRTRDGMVEDIDDLAGLAKRNGMMAFVLGALMFSLAGIPWMAGFFAKLYVFRAAIQAELYTLAVIGVLASVVGAFYYLRIVKIMYFDDPDKEFLPMPRRMKMILGISSIIVIFYVIYPAALLNVAEVAAASLF